MTREKANTLVNPKIDSTPTINIVETNYLQLGLSASWVPKVGGV
jgi:hypothetical protein